MEAAYQENLGKNGNTDMCTHENNDINAGTNFCKRKTCLLCGSTLSYYLRINNLALSIRGQRCKERDSGKIGGYTKQVSACSSRCLQSNSYRSAACRNHGICNTRATLICCRQRLKYALEMGGQMAFIRKQCKNVASKTVEARNSYPSRYSM